MDILSLLREERIFAVLRGLNGEKLLKTGAALLKGGIHVAEVTFDPVGSILDTAEAIAALKAEFAGELAVGAGTVLTLPQLAAAREAGAAYIVSPNFNETLVAATKAAGLVSIPGAMTPTEIVSAYDAGADMIKVFPAGQLGAEYFAALKAPLSHIPLAAVAGITPENIRDFVRAGAAAFGISGGIVHRPSIEAGVYNEIVRRADSYRAALKGV